MNRYVPFILCLLVAFTAFAATNVTGTWETALPGRDGSERPYVFELKQAPDGSLSGVVIGFRSEGPVQDGKLTGDRIQFSAENQYMARNVLMTFTGTVDGGEMKLTVTFEDNHDELKIVARRK